MWGGGRGWQRSGRAVSGRIQKVAAALVILEGTWEFLFHSEAIGWS